VHYQTFYITFLHSQQRQSNEGICNTHNMNYCMVQGDTKNDLLLFTLAALLSSTLVYNSRGTIDQQAVERLRSVSCDIFIILFHFCFFVIILNQNYNTIHYDFLQ